MSKEKNITVMCIEPKRFPKVITIENDLRSLQKEVNGLIECIDLSDDITLICNDEGKLMNLSPNRAIKGENGQIMDIVAGNIIVAGFDCKSGEFCSLTPEQIEKVSAEYQYPEMFFKHHDQIYAIGCDCKLIQTSPVELAFIAQDGTIKESFHFDNDRECFYFGFMINQLYLEIANANIDELKDIQLPYDLKAYEK
ncbi:MAG: DUF3846 domain-containing protein, partial [Oscillospiraceae bacterium]|nr:DUF3846 domain-containing protein [Oscillospiraceae bacterium]